MFSFFLEKKVGPKKSNTTEEIVYQLKQDLLYHSLPQGWGKNGKRIMNGMDKTIISKNLTKKLATHVSEWSQYQISLHELTWALHAMKKRKTP